MDTHNKIITFGIHKGERWTRLPAGYLKWIANELQGKARAMAEAELERRGTSFKTMDIELSGHAIDRASQISKEWKKEGVYSWLLEIASQALIFAENSQGTESVSYMNYKFVFKHANHYPILKTIIKLNNKHEARKNKNREFESEQDES